MKTSKDLWIRVIDKELPVGSTSNAYPCPKCGRAGSFSITKESTGILKYICHRASCPVRGIYGGTMGVPAPRPEFQPRVYTGALRTLGVHEQAILLARYGVTSAAIEEAGWRYGMEDDRLVMPVLSPFRAVRGYIARRIKSGDSAKVLPYKEKDDTFIGWAACGGPVVIVEDLISAVRAAQYVSSVAILGTHLNWDMVHEITTYSDRQIICLDKDATDKAIDYSKKYALHGNFSVYPLSKDIKDMDEEEYKGWLRGINTTLGA